MQLAVLVGTNPDSVGSAHLEVTERGSTAEKTNHRRTIIMVDCT